MWFFLNSLLPSFYKLRDNYKLVVPRIKYGFNSRTEFIYKDELSEIRGTRPGQFTGNEVTMFGIYEGVTTTDVPIYDGIQRDMIDTEGRLDIALITEKMAKYAIEKKNLPVFVGTMHDSASCQNSVSLFYNLLRMYYIEVNKDVKYLPGENFYNNGHVKIVNTQVFTTHITASTLGNSVLQVDGRVDVDKKPLERGDFDVPAYLWNGRISYAQVDILTRAVGQWKQQAPFALSHNSDTLAERITINPSGSDEKIEANRVTSKTILEVIDNLVSSNRLFTDFSYAYMMLAQIFVSPVPRSAEATAWLIGTQTINMPSLRCMTGYVPMLAEGVPFARRADWMDTYRTWRKETGAILFHSIAVVEAAYVELANVVKLRDTEAINSDNFVQASVDGSPVSFGGIIQDLSLVSTRYGCKIDIPYALSCGLNRSQGLITNAEIKVPVTITDAEAHSYYSLEVTPAVVQMENVLVVTQLTAAMYPVMTFGINEDTYYANGLSDEVTATATESDRGDIIFTNVVDFTKFMNVLRMMGYDVTAIEALSRRKVTNWADNSSGRFLYTDVNLDNNAQVYIIHRDNITKRPNAWIDIGQKCGSVTLKYKMTDLRMKLFNGQQDLQLAGTIIAESQKVVGLEKMVRSGTTTEGIRFIPLTKVRESDFRLVRYQLAPITRAQPMLPLPGALVESGDNIPDSETIGVPLDVM